jgi:hypothetical protein
VIRQTSRFPHKQTITREAIVPVKKPKDFTGGIVMAKDVRRPAIMEDEGRNSKGV